MNTAPAAPGMLTPAEYQLLAAPALQVAAEMAAQRGDPHLYNDMASMLALLGMVSALVHAYLEDEAKPGDASPQPVLEAAPLAVTALVFTESGLEVAEVDACLKALSVAYLQLLKLGILGPQDAYVEKAYRELSRGERPAGGQSLKQAAFAMARAVDAWEASREEGARS
ncbi:MAG TPA: hypothetical protein VGO35_12995 [Gammaproteobacteria bacterium]|nr:hypothetical protein [Gammaproteobacteria bacterium]